MANPITDRLEEYSLQHPEEVLVVHAEIDDTQDEVVIYRGFSSSLMRSTAFDLDVPVLPETAIIQSIDRMKGPLNPQNPVPIETDIAWDDFSRRL